MDVIPVEGARSPCTTVTLSSTRATKASSVIRLLAAGSSAEEEEEEEEEEDDGAGGEDEEGGEEEGVLSHESLKLRKAGDSRTIFSKRAWAVWLSLPRIRQYICATSGATHSSLATYI